MGPSLDLSAPVARPLIASRAASMASSGSDLRWLRRDCRLGRSTSTISMPVAAGTESTRWHRSSSLRHRPWSPGRSPRARPTGPCSRRHRPGRTRCRSGGRGGRGLQLTWVSRWVSTPPVIPGGASTKVIAVPNFLNVDGDGTAVPDQGDGRFGLLAQAGPITLLWDGTCRFQSVAERAQPTTPEDARGRQVRPNLPGLPKLLRTSCHGVDP